MKLSHTTVFLLVFALIGIVSCSKSSTSDPVAGTEDLSYGDSVLYIKNTATDYLVAPVSGGTGTYESFPKGLSINPATGVINVSKSETGLRYRITFRDANGQVHTTHVTIGGINYLDKYYNLSLNDTMAVPIYNGDPSLAVPSGNYDVGNGANREGLAVVNSNGTINLMQCVRNGLFGRTPKNDEWEEIEIKYTSNDRSNSAVNKISIIIYYYNTANDVPENIRDIMTAHQSMVLGTTYVPIPSTPMTEKNGISPALLGRPRPPCIIIVGH